MKKNILLITIIMPLLLILFASCTANTKPNIYHSLITIKTSSITNPALPISVYISKSNENSYELMGILHIINIQKNMTAAQNHTI
ncbi:hypothetical protein [Brachyspira alvinipulli]|uniref:hypothetical protein n=1 Tax=Brachyspira alvinipulli TaxID=84379 RepID=UPI00048535AB|nr:hypothetical protein [Brachyspira alvinipulli]